MAAMNGDTLLTWTGSSWKVFWPSVIVNDFAVVGDSLYALSQSRVWLYNGSGWLAITMADTQSISSDGGYLIAFRNGVRRRFDGSTWLA